MLSLEIATVSDRSLFLFLAPAHEARGQVATNAPGADVAYVPEPRAGYSRNGAIDGEG